MPLKIEEHERSFRFTASIELSKQRVEDLSLTELVELLQDEIYHDAIQALIGDVTS